ncbi:MAG: DNA-directed RNA polymerase subunit N [Candidatus Nitrosothermus koennekii]|nr:MAG: DNA-directed RNA polymerase subunit N [Candidatus Nitrosothermus koennekii]
MLIPIRCFTCGALIADKYQVYQQRIKNGEDPEEVMNDLRIKRYCCRRMFIGTVETLHQILPYYEALARRREEMQLE